MVSIACLGLVFPELKHLVSDSFNLVRPCIDILRSCYDCSIEILDGLTTIYAKSFSVVTLK